MEKKLLGTRPKKYLLAFLSLILLGAMPFFAGSGLDEAKPLGNYLNSNFPANLPPRLPYEPVFPNITFDSPLTFNEVPNTNKIIIGQRDGRIFWFDKTPNVSTKNVLVDLSDKVGLVWDGGFLGLALHPEFGASDNNYFYAYYSTEDSNGADFPNFYTTQSCDSEEYWGNFLVLARYEMDPITLDVQESSEQILLKLRMYGTTHRGGGLLFGDDGFLYLTTGDQTAFKKAQDITNNLDGGVLRLDVDKDNTKSHPPVRTMPDDHGFSDEITGNGYWIPNDNPFLSPTGENFEEYYSMGHRNPHRMTKDRGTGDLYVGEIGGNRHEEINVIKKGSNYGWPVYEGLYENRNCVSDLLNGMPHEIPLTFFPRAEANAIIGGYVYRGSEIPELQGKYICADYGNGEEIWSIDIDTGEYTQLGNFTSTNIISFGEDERAELYIMKQGVSTLYKMVSKDDPFSTLPKFLSETGAFINLNTLEPTDGLIPYDLVESFWSDGALKKRWVGIPNNGSHNTPAEKIQYSENDVWNFPVGSVLIKHFELPVNENDPSITKRLETRFSIKGDNGNFYFATYKWNDQETDAELLTSGLDETINIIKADGSTSTQTWQYPSNSACISCHNPTSGGTLGLRTRYLNKDFTYPETGRTANQLVTLSHLEILDEEIADADTDALLTAKAMNDSNASLDEKARSYLDLNCAYCHRPGTGNRGNFDLRLKLDLAQTQLLTASPFEFLGMQNARIVDPGNSESSLLYHRLNSTDPTIMMPPIAKNEIDDNAVALIGEWIGQLTYSGASSVDVAEGIYYIENKSSGKIIEIADALTTNMANVQQGTYADLPNQQFEIKKETEIRYKFKAEHSDKFVDVAFAGQAPGTNVWQYAGNAGNAQAWSFEDAGDGYVYIISKANGLFLDVADASTEDGANIQMWTANYGDSQKWKLNTVNNCPPAGTSCDDGDSSTTDDVEDGNCNCAGTPISSGTEFCTGISTSWDDAEERASNGSMNAGSSDLELVSDGGEQLVGLRFNGIDIPQGAVIESAHIQFTTDETGTGTTGLTIRAEASDNAIGFGPAAGNLSSRNLTGASVGWSPSAWNTQGEAGAVQKTPDLRSVVQEVVNRSGYVQGNSLAFIISGSGRRTAESYDGSVQGAPRLCIVYNTDGSCPVAGTPCDDGNTNTVDDTEDGNCNCTGTPVASGEVCSRVSTSSDDAEERVSNGTMNMGSSDLELVSDGGEQLVGIRFNGIDIPQGAIIESAHIQFTVDESSTGSGNLTIKAEATDNAGPLSSNTGNLSSRNLTGASVGWSPSAWNTPGESGAAQRTPNLRTVVQEIIDRPSFSAGNSLVFIVSGSGTRTAESYDGSPQSAPELCIVYNTDANCLAAGTPCDDGNVNTIDDVEDGNCNCAGTPVTSGEVCSGISTSRDDVEEHVSTGDMNMGSSDLELVTDNGFIGGQQIVGLRFNGIDIPQGAVIDRAHIQFTTDEVGTGSGSLSIRAEATDNAVAFSSGTGNLSARDLTGASVDWGPPPWNTQGESGAAQKTPDLREVVQEIVDRPGFASGSSMVFIITGSGTRTAESYDGSPQSAPQLCITYSGSDNGIRLSAQIDQDIAADPPIQDNDVVLYPNPTAGTLYLDLMNYEETALYCTVFNASQQVVHETYFDEAHMRIERLDLDNLSDGMYTISIRSKRGHVSKIILVKR